MAIQGIKGTPSLREVMPVARQIAAAFGVEAPTLEDLEARLGDLLFRGDKLWACFEAEIVTADEVASRVLAELESWLRHRGGIPWDEHTDWLTPEIEQQVRRALFPKNPHQG